MPVAKKADSPAKAGVKPAPASPAKPPAHARATSPSPKRKSVNRQPVTAFSTASKARRPEGWQKYHYTGRYVAFPNEKDVQQAQEKARAQHMVCAFGTRVACPSSPHRSISPNHAKKRSPKKNAKASPKKQAKDKAAKEEAAAAPVEAEPAAQPELRALAALGACDGTASFFYLNALLSCRGPARPVVCPVFARRRIVGGVMADGSVVCEGVLLEEVEEREAATVDATRRIVGGVMPDGSVVCEGVLVAEEEESTFDVTRRIVGGLLADGSVVCEGVFAEAPAEATLDAARRIVGGTLADGSVVCEGVVVLPSEQRTLLQLLCESSPAGYALLRALI